MRPIHFATTTVAAIALTSPLAFAQYTGPGQAVITELAKVLTEPVDDQQVKLQGYLVKKVSSDKYIFSDGKQEIRVEIDQDKFPAQPFNEKDKIEIAGEVEKDFLESPEIDVDSLRLVQP